MPVSEIKTYACQMHDEKADLEWMQGTTRFYCQRCDETFDMYNRRVEDPESQRRAPRMKGKQDMGSDWPLVWSRG